VGIDLTILSVFGGALGVGLGFGLQKIASNYVSGFIILLDKSVKIGDLVTVGGFTGKVTEINTRFTVVRSAGGVESIVPNESFVTSQVQNLSYSDSPTLQTVEISVAYNADVKKALELMLDEVGRDRPRIPKDRKPWASVSRFASSGIDLNVNFWVEDPVNGTAGIKTDIMMNLLRRFAEAGIEIPYNRLEIDILNNKNKALENQ
ncbi:MAG TPA: transporter, partial [Sutterella wadsworthensis]|nr:transporter [Sutterella wadsworthensis]